MAGGEDATFVSWLADRYTSAQVTAVDIDEAAIAACLEVRPQRYADRVHARVSYFADVEPESVDLVTAFDVFHHIEDDAGAARDLFHAPRPGGTMLVHVPRDRWLAHVGQVHRVPDEEAWRVNPGHVRTGYSPARMEALLKGAGLRRPQHRDLHRPLGDAGAPSVQAAGAPSVSQGALAAGAGRLRPCSTCDSPHRGNSVFAHAVKPLERIGQPSVVAWPNVLGMVRRGQFLATIAVWLLVALCGMVLGFRDTARV